ncbi:hypothetical protein HMPREF1987_01184 [Peptostreptococcaceae bacterium oral taxon 113 str. W5053]|nr:hypothetical protein HMPREF1987_01184 [Peptostreptococcaceae bacterium oral taxon 113 str. W5053]
MYTQQMPIYYPNTFFIFIFLSEGRACLYLYSVSILRHIS